MAKRKALKIVLIVVLSIVTVVIFFVPAVAAVSMLQPAMKPIRYDPVSPDYWPTESWRMSTPEEQGMDSAKLLEMIEYYQKTYSEKNTMAIDSITIVRNGYIVADMYFNPLYDEDDTHIIHSVTKSVMSALIGIAIDRGYLESVDVRIVDIFDDEDREGRDSRWDVLTVKHLLTMQTGLHTRDSYLYGYEGLFAMQKTDDWVQYFLGRSFEEDPGTRFEYSNCASFMLSAVIQRCTGMDTLQFAQENLFGPLGIDDVQWEKSPGGISIGWARMWLKPGDMAKLGLLSLQKGNWDGRQILPAQWIDDTLTAHSLPKKYRKVYDENGKWDLLMSGGDFMNTYFNRPFSDGYGYQVWLDKAGRYSAVGTGGQYIMIAPSENMIVVFTAKLSGTDAFFPETLFERYILASLVADHPIQADESAQKKLLALRTPPQLSASPKPVPALPGIASEISGKTYSLEKNNWDYDNFRLDFESGTDTAQFGYTAKMSDVVSYMIGLDGIPRLTDTNNAIYAARGYWETPDTFVIHVEIIGYSTRDEWRLTFDGGDLYVEEIGVTGTYRYGGTMKQE